MSFKIWGFSLFLITLIFFLLANTIVMMIKKLKNTLNAKPKAITPTNKKLITLTQPAFPIGLSFKITFILSPLIAKNYIGIDPFFMT